MSPRTDSDYTEVRAVPSVSRDRWIDHARKKLEKGYTLIVSDTRRNANFYRPDKGYETCQHKTALLLVKQGIVKKAGKHHLGTMYRLSDQALDLKTVAPANEDEEEFRVAASEAEYEDILDQIEATEEDEDDEATDDD